MASRHVSRVAVMLAAALTLAACAADGDPGEAPLGPTVVADASSPSGYTVTFRYEDPAADQVWLAGDLYFAKPSSLAIDGATSSWLGGEWSNGDVSTLPRAADLAELTRGEDGVWELTTAVPAGLWNYGFVTRECSLILVCSVDADPANAPALAAAADATQEWSQ
ncbi:MAG: hypothetical protein ACK5IM_03965, partial [Demequina sp.]|uniref:hypothetical protein n=1 Tax=Demequina sp. TaxID=2050685 RepID=UPI003A8A1CEC